MDHFKNFSAVLTNKINQMSQIIKKSINWNNKELTIETGKIARQASGSVVVSYGETVVLAAVTVASKAAEHADFFPLTVHYLEKFYAAGRMLGGFNKREGKPSEDATLVSRLIDRPIRPLFPSNFYNEVNVICTVLSYGNDDNCDIISLIAASAALAISEAPFLESVGAVRVAKVNQQLVFNPTKDQLKNSSLDLIVAGTKSSVLMVESEAKELTESEMLEAVSLGHQNFQPIIDLINELHSTAGKTKIAVPAFAHHQLKAEIKDLIGSRMVDAYKISSKQARSKALESLHSEVKEKFIKEEDGINSNLIKAIFKNLEQEIVRQDTLKNKVRLDGRSLDQVREITSEVGFLPKVHGSSLFTRGETQALVALTLGSPRDAQLVENLSGVYNENFMLHYNFPPYSVGEVGQLKTPGRREIGHGKLAWRAINPVMCNSEEFNYSIRLVSEITESNGSSSMATVCGASLALMDAGVPIKSPVSGIAMGLIKEGDQFVVLSDIMGDEDHLGDMDFKVAGTSKGITALQMDIKINGISTEIMQQALEQANRGRLSILEKMIETIATPRSELNGNIPKVETITIPSAKIRDVIGSRGKTIKEICQNCSVTIDIEDSGVVKISGNNNEAIQKAITTIQEITFEPEIGDIYEGPVVKVIDAGAFVSIANNRDGFVHISELANYRVDFVEDVINEGDIVKVKVIGFDKKARPKLSFRSVDQQTGADISDTITSKSLNEDFEDDQGGRRPDRRGGDRPDNRSSDRRDRGDRDRNSSRDSSRDSSREGGDDRFPKKRKGFFS
jgi:polyribonucleotide nucleotidyltransferase